MKNYKEKYQEFYNSKEWKVLRAERFAHDNGMCVECKKKGKIKAGKEVHHIHDIEHYWDNRLDFDNLETLCSDCHNMIHNRISPLQSFLQDWERG